MLRITCSTARAAASREKSKSKTTQTRKDNLREGKMITGYEVCKDPAEGEFQKNGHAADAMCRLPAVKTHLSHTRSAEKALQTIMCKLPAVKTHLSLTRSASKPPAEDMCISAAE